jgi:hypothetical protein
MQERLVQSIYTDMESSGNRWYSHPLVNVLSLAIGVVGILLASFFYLKSKASREPYFYLEPERTILVNRDLAIGQKLAVSYDGYTGATGDITAVQCYFWNAGGTPIHSQDVLEPIAVALPVGNEILEAAVIRQSRPSIVDFRVTSEVGGDGKRTNTASIRFKILEKGDGASLQIVYAGGPEVPIQFSGAIEGAAIQQLKKPGEESALKHVRLDRWRIVTTIMGLSGLIFIPVSIFLFRLRERLTADIPIGLAIRSSFHIFAHSGIWELIFFFLLGGVMSAYIPLLLHPGVPPTLTPH